MISPRNSVRRCGQALIEFAVIALIVTLLVFGTISFGLLLHGANVIQQAADVGAQELSRLPLPADITFADALDRSDVKAQIFDEQYLLIDLAGKPPGISTLAYVDTLPLPIINRLLIPVMLFDRPPGFSDAGVFRYPGAIVSRDGVPTVLVPLVVARDGSTGSETLEWHRVVEEIPDPSAPGASPMSVLSPGTQKGILALRINFPHQSAVLSGFQRGDPTPEDPIPANLNRAIVADDQKVNAPPPPAPYDLWIGVNAPPEQGELQSQSGRFGLGRMASILPVERGSSVPYVRPFRKVLSAQGIYRREVFGP